MIAGLHITQQFLFGLDEAQEMRGFAGIFYGWFSNKDYATVTLVALLVLVLRMQQSSRGPASSSIKVGLLQLAKP